VVDHPLATHHFSIFFFFNLIFLKNKKIYIYNVGFFSNFD
jgi:hypothetical protein